LLYQAKPQRGGRSIQTNTNNPPQDPPPPPEIILTNDVTAPGVIIPIEEPIVDVVTIPEIIKTAPLLIKIKPTPKEIQKIIVSPPTVTPPAATHEVPLYVSSSLVVIL